MIMLFRRAAMVAAGATAVVTCVPAAKGEAQRPALSSPAISQIVDVALNALVHPDTLLSRVSVADRKVYFDHARTLAAFGYAGVPPTTRLGLQSPVNAASRAILSDCDQRGTGPCRQLGWSAYVWIEPIVISKDAATIRLWVSWPDRGRAPYLHDIQPSGRASLVGFGSEVYLVRGANGQWKFDHEGRAVVSE